MADVSRRTFDVAVLRDAPGAPEGRRRVAILAADGADVATGPIKLVQRVALDFLTRRGSLPFSPGRGSPFMDAASSGLLRSEVDVVQQFAFAAAATTRNLRAEEAAGDPADERLGSLRLERAVVEPGRLTLHVRIEAASGAGAVAEIPVPTP